MSECKAGPGRRGPPKPGVFGALTEDGAERLARVLGTASAFGFDAWFEGLSPERRRRALGAGRAILAGGETALGALLEGVMPRFMASRGVWSDGKIFGEIHGWLEGRGSGPEFEPVRDFVRDWAAANLPVGESYVLLGKKIPVRLVHSVHSLHLETGEHPKRLRKLLAAAGVIAPSSDGLTDGRTLFTVAALEPVRDRVLGTMTLAAAADYLNAPRPQERLLLDSGFISPVLEGSKTGDTKHVFARADLDRFLSRLRASASPAGPSAAALVSIPAAARRANCSAAEIVALILDGGLETVRLDPNSRGYLAVLVDPAEVAGLVRRAGHGGLSLREASRAMGTDDRVVKALVELRHLPSRVAANPVKRNAQRVVDRRDVDAFLVRNVSLTALAAERGEHSRHVAARMKEAGLLPVFDPAAVGATFFDRAACSEVPTARDERAVGDGPPCGRRPRA